MFNYLSKKFNEYNSINLLNAIVLNFVAVFGFYLFFSSDFIDILKSISVTSTFFYFLFFGVYLINSREKKHNKSYKNFFRKKKVFDSNSEELLKKQMKELMARKTS